MGLQVPIEMIEAARRGHPRDIETLLEAVWADAYRLSQAIVGQRQLAEDVAQESCITTFRRITSLRNPEAFRSWFYRIVVRESIKHKKLQLALTDDLPDSIYREDPSTSLDLWRALAALTEKQRTAIVLHYFERLSTREIAHVLSIPEATVRFRLMTARRKLKPRMQEIIPNADVKGKEIRAL